MIFLFLGYNYIQTGNLFLTPFTKHCPYDRLGFGKDLGWSKWMWTRRSHTFSKGVVNIFKTLIDLSNWLPLLSFLFIFTVLLLNRDKTIYLLFSFLVSLGVGYVFYFYRDIRYFYCSLFAISIIFARLIIILPSYLKKFNISLSSTSIFKIFLLILIFNMFFVVLPRTIKRYNWIKVTVDPYKIVKRRKITNAIIFIKSTPRYYPIWYTRNSPTLNDDVLYIRDLGKWNKLLINYYPRRKKFVYTYDKKRRLGKLEEKR
jgi:hypothetical protein